MKMNTLLLIFFNETFTNNYAYMHMVSYNSVHFVFYNWMKTQGEAKEAFIIFDEAYEGNDVDAFYLGDILRALGCTLTNKSIVELGGATELGK